MSRSLPPLNALRAFEAAGRYESFTLAAQELNVSHSAVSRHVRGLEARLGVCLFRDLPRGVALTPEGRAYLGRVMPALDAIAEATEGLTEAPSGRITLNSEPLFAMKVLLPRLPQFAAAYPEVELRLEATSQVVDVERFEADMAIRFVSRRARDAHSDLICDRPLSICAAPEVARRIRTPEDLLGERLLKDRGAPVWNRWFAAQGITDAPMDTGWRMRAMLALEATLHGYGVFLGGQEYIAADLAAGRLYCLYETDIRAGETCLVYGPRGLRSKAARVFRNWLLEQTADLRGSERPGYDQPNG